MAFSALKNGLKLGRSVLTSKHSLLYSGVLKIKTDVVRTRNIATISGCNNCNNLLKTQNRNITSDVAFSRSYSKGAEIQHATRKYQSASESDSDLEWIGHRGESEFWRRKIRTFHSILDLNKDGVISYEDFKILADRFVNLGHLDEKHTKEFYSVIKSLWEKQFGEITPYNLITVEKYLENMHHVLNDKRLVRKAHSFLPYLFKALDKDKSGKIAEAEFKIFFKCLGLNEYDATLAFRAIDSNGDGKISSKEFVKHGRDFFLTEDEDRISKYFWGPLVDH